MYEHGYVWLRSSLGGLLVLTTCSTPILTLITSSWQASKLVNRTNNGDKANKDRAWTGE